MRGASEPRGQVVPKLRFDVPLFRIALQGRAGQGRAGQVLCYVTADAVLTGAAGARHGMAWHGMLVCLGISKGERE